MQPWMQLVAVGLVVGVFNGSVFLASDWEQRARQRRPFLLFGSGSMPAILASMLLITVPLSLALFLGLPLLPLKLLGLLPFYGDDHKIFFGTYLAAIGLGKAMRYGFWKWRFKEHVF